VDYSARFAVRGLLGRIAAVVILARVSYHGRYILDDLKHYVETGTPSRRKLAHRHH
jgi:hypothetical protein